MARFLRLKTGMKKSFALILLSVMLILLASGCRKRDITTDRQQLILFQYEYLGNNAHNGFLIDKEGNVYTYNNPSTWNYPDKDLEISQEQVAENFGNCLFSGVKVPQEELNKFSKVIDFIASSKVTAPGKTETTDGTHLYFCYQFDENSQMYKGYLVRSEGRITRENLNFHAKRVVLWMKEINLGLSF